MSPCSKSRRWRRRDPIGEKLKFSPGDRILDVYRAVYPSRWTPDALGLEAFAEELDK